MLEIYFLKQALFYFDLEDFMKFTNLNLKLGFNIVKTLFFITVFYFIYPIFKTLKASFSKFY